MQAYGLSNNSPQTSLKRRVQVYDIKVIDIGFENIVNFITKEFTMPVPVLHGVPTEYDVCTEWDAIDEIEPISSHIGQQCIQIKANILTDWNSDSKYPHFTLNDEICHAKLDTGAQINMMMEYLFKHIGKINIAIIPQVRCPTGWLWQ